MLDYFEKRYAKAPWYTRWWWAIALGVVAIVAGILWALADSAAKKKSARRRKELTDEANNVVVKNETLVEKTKTDLHEVVEERKELEALDAKLEEKNETYDDLVDRVRKAKDLRELRALRDEIERS